MPEAAEEFKSTPVDLAGLDEVFDVQVEPLSLVSKGVARFDDQGDYHPINQGVGLSLKAAALHLNLATSTLRLKIKKGEILAKKIDGPNGPEWRIFLPEENKRAASRQGDSRVTSTPPDYQRAEEQERLIELLEKQSIKLEAAAGQIGYLSAQVESYQHQVKLLPDLQMQASKVEKHEELIKELEGELTSLKSSFWYKISRWFVGKQ